MDPEKVKAVVEWPSPDSRRPYSGFWGSPISTDGLFVISAN